MAGHVYQAECVRWLTKLRDLTVDDIRVALLDETTTADTEREESNILGFVTLGEIVATNYVSGGAALAGEAVTQDDANFRAEFDATDLTFSAIGGASDDTIHFLLLYFFDTSFVSATSFPIALYDAAEIVAFPLTTNGGDITFRWNAEGLLQVTG